METSRAVAIALLAACGALMMLLSFLPWISFSSFESDFLDGDFLPDTSISITGTETSRLRDIETIERDTIKEVDQWCSCRVSFGDGYLVAALGFAVMGTAALAFLSGRSGPAGSIATVASGIALTVAAYNAMADWRAFAWTDERQTEVLDGAVTPFLWALVAVCAAATVLGTALWSMARLEGDEDMAFEEDDGEYELPERLNAWA